MSPRNSPANNPPTGSPCLNSKQTSKQKTQMRTPRTLINTARKTHHNFGEKTSFSRGNISTTQLGTTSPQPIPPYGQEAGRQHAKAAKYLREAKHSIYRIYVSRSLGCFQRINLSVFLHTSFKIYLEKNFLKTKMHSAGT